MDNSLAVKVHYMPGSRKCQPNGKGVHREAKSEGSRRQSSEPTNRNRIRRRGRADEAAAQVKVPYFDAPAYQPLDPYLYMEEDPEAEGKQFAGWITEDGTLAEDLIIGQDTVLTASYW